MNQQQSIALACFPSQSAHGKIEDTSSCPLFPTRKISIMPHVAAGRTLKECLCKMIRMIVATRLGGLPGNVRYPDTSFGFNTKQLNHQDKSTLGDISSLKQPLELLVSLTLPPNNTHNTHNTHTTRTTPPQHQKKENKTM